MDVHGKDEAGVPVDFTTGQLLVELPTEQLRSNTAVDLKTPDQRLQAIGLVASFDGTQVRLLNQVRAEINE